MNAAWRTRRATDSAQAGGRVVDLRVTSAARGGWTLNGVPQPRLAGCADVDLGFTPATNLLPIRRLALKVGERAEAPAANPPMATAASMRHPVLPRWIRSSSAREMFFPSASRSSS